MKTRSQLNRFLLSVLSVVALICIVRACAGQTVLKNIPIESRTPFQVQVYDSLDTSPYWGWKTSDEVYSPIFRIWEWEKEIDLYVQPFALLQIRFVTCTDTTYMDVYGSQAKQVIKDSEVLLNGLKIEFGNKPKVYNHDGSIN